jgi:hypothetical protein
LFDDAATRMAIAEVIRGAVGDTPIIYPFWALGFEPADWPGVIRIATGKAHGYVVRFRGVTAIQGPGTGGHIAADQTIAYEVVAVCSYGDGSEDQFAGELLAIAGALRPGAYITVPPDCSLKTGGMQWNADLYGLGGELCHVAFGALEVYFRLC